MNYLYLLSRGEDKTPKINFNLQYFYFFPKSYVWPFVRIVLLTRF